jgi:hypothetical protein
MFTALAIVASAVVPVSADNHVVYYNHNGSVMKMVWDQEVGEFFEMFYHKPRAGLGIKRGTRLLTGGDPAGGDVYATAKVFKKGCEPAEYRVTGQFDDSGNLSLTGAAPIRSGCAVTGYGALNSSSLVFTKR